MRHLKRFFPLMLMILCLALAGCSGSSSSNPSDPLASGTPIEDAPTGNGDVLAYSLSLKLTDLLETGYTVGVGANVLAKARLTDSMGNTVANQPIKFEPVDSSAPVTITTPIVNTASTGEAINFFTAGTPATTTDIVIKASTSINGQYISTIGIFRILRSQGNVINFLTTKGEATDPDGNLNTLSKTITNVSPTANPTYGFVQLVPFQVLDLNGIPRQRASVKLRIYSVLGSGCSAFIDSPELPIEKTVTTDDTGLGMFNAAVSIPTPPVGGTSACSVIYQATADNLLAGTTPEIYSYGGYIVSLENLPPQ